MIEDDDIDSPEYYDLYEDLKNRLCEENEESEEDKVCCPEDDIKVGSFSSITSPIGFGTVMKGISYVVFGLSMFNLFICELS